MGTEDILTRARTDLFRVDGVNAFEAAVVVGVIVAAVSAELSFHLGTVRIPLVIYLLTFVAVLLSAHVVDTGTELCRALALVPLFRLVNLGMPVFVEATLAWLALVYASLAVATVITAATLAPARLTGTDQLRGLVLFSPLVVGAAVLFGAVEYSILMPDPLVGSVSGPQGLALVVVMVGLAGLGEELLFRGVIQSTVASRAGPGPAVAVSTLLFTVLHAGLVLPEAVAWAGITGLLLSTYYQLAANWVVTGVLRGVSNVLLYGVFPVLGPLPALLG